jgi:hypothetical protein
MVFVIRARVRVFDPVICHLDFGFDI